MIQRNSHSNAGQPLAHTRPHIRNLPGGYGRTVRKNPSKERLGPFNFQLPQLEDLSIKSTNIETQWFGTLAMESSDKLLYACRQLLLKIVEASDKLFHACRELLLRIVLIVSIKHMNNSSKAFMVSNRSSERSSMAKQLSPSRGFSIMSCPRAWQAFSKICIFFLSMRYVGFFNGLKSGMSFDSAVSMPRNCRDDGLRR